MYKTDRVPARFSVVSVQGSELPEVQPVASVLSLLGRVPVRFQALDRPILDLKLPDPIPRTNRPVRVHLNTETRYDRNPLLPWAKATPSKMDMIARICMSKALPLVLILYYDLGFKDNLYFAAILQT